ncbi:MAG: hypothetical protein COW76_20530 [Shewanella sp. CG18_big_fil_WC_8_21_14_2_50_42_11]|uniref:hypothetical protein n=1 Tax=Shewanella sp. CG18_big_fil_WC_8_21_14_2_50_42_11 TaxID=1975538 RepID=UPI000C395E61|nr:hypothetical protein [Shewanella sp. CG18_big_fil_WC_8_21_14_2_50_42_11]PIP98551.1 MAG: hypothetical protein COW76_20530 [Shewanella sp. CG18_big_fil_WC_8_21_14_2_50_42_11]
MAIKLNVNRTQKIEVPVPVGEEMQSFFAEMRILKKDEDAKVVDLITSISGLELTDDTGRTLTPEETIKAVKDDAQLSGLIASAWALGNENLAKKQRTWLEQSNT